jgi:hypothetical protein
MAMPDINGVSSMLQGGEKALYIAGRCEQFWVISLFWKALGHWVPRYAERIASHETDEKTTLVVIRYQLFVIRLILKDISNRKATGWGKERLPQLTNNQ